MPGASTPDTLFYTNTCVIIQTGLKKKKKIKNPLGTTPWPDNATLQPVLTWLDFLQNSALEVLLLLKPLRAEGTCVRICPRF